VFPGETTLNFGSTLAAAGALSLLASVVISGAITTILLGVILWTVRRRSAVRKPPVDEPA
jgi:hypothetical protein